MTSPNERILPASPASFVSSTGAQELAPVHLPFSDHPEDVPGVRDRVPVGGVVRRQRN
jgi:hypothetical protein